MRTRTRTRTRTGTGTGTGTGAEGEVYAAAAEQPSFLHFACRRLKWRARGVLAFQSLSFLMQALDVKLTEEYVRE
jgi:hypothetical protein